MQLAGTALGHVAYVNATRSNRRRDRRGVSYAQTHARASVNTVSARCRYRRTAVVENDARPIRSRVIDRNGAKNKRADIGIAVDCSARSVAERQSVELVIGDNVEPITGAGDCWRCSACCGQCVAVDDGRDAA